MAATAIASAGTTANVTGYGWQSHLLFDGTRWWCFYLDSTQATKLLSAYSSDLSSWSAGATLTCPSSANFHAGPSVAFATKTISGTIVVHAAFESDLSTLSSYRVRGTISGTTLTWGTPTLLAQGGGSVQSPFGNGIAFSTDDKVYIGWNAAGGGDAGVTRSTDADTGSAAPTTWSSGGVMTSSNYCNAQIPLSLASGNMLMLAEKYTAAEATSLKNVMWSKWTGSWSAKADIFSDLGAGVAPNNFGACLLSTSDIHCVLRTGANTYSHSRFNGTSWSAGSAITNQNSVAGSNLYMVSDGTNVWLFIIDSDSANTIRYSKWDGSSWGAWTAFETSTQARNYISGWAGPIASGGTIGVLWTQTNGSNYDVVVEGLLTASGPSIPALLAEDDDL